VNYIVRLAGERAKLGRVWPHLLRQSYGYYLADRGTDLRTMQDYLGTRDPKHTAHYTRSPGIGSRGCGDSNGRRYGVLCCCDFFGTSFGTGATAFG